MRSFKKHYIKMIFAIIVIVLGVLFEPTVNGPRNATLDEIESKIIMNTTNNPEDGFVRKIDIQKSNDSSRVEFVAENSRIVIAYRVGFYYTSDRFLYEARLWDLTALNITTLTGLTNAQKADQLNTYYSNNDTTTILSLQSFSSNVESLSNHTVISSLVVGHVYFLQLVKMANEDFYGNIFHYVENYDAVIYTKDNYNDYSRIGSIGQAIIWIAVCVLVCFIMGFMFDKTNPKCPKCKCANDPKAKKCQRCGEPVDFS